MICINDPDLDATQVTITQYLQPDMVNPHFPPPTLTLTAQTAANMCYTTAPLVVAGPAGTWSTTVNVIDAKGLSSGPTFTIPTAFTVT